MSALGTAPSSVDRSSAPTPRATTRGSAVAVVTATGMGTELGQVAQLAAGAAPEDSPLTRNLARLSSQLVAVTLLIGNAAHPLWWLIILTALVPMPSPSKAGLPVLLFPVNPPSWSLFWELVVNLAFAFVAANDVRSAFRYLGEYINSASADNAETVKVAHLLRNAMLEELEKGTLFKGEPWTPPQKPPSK